MFYTDSESPPKELSLSSPSNNLFSEANLLTDSNSVTFPILQLIFSRITSKMNHLFLHCDLFWKTQL